MALTTITSAPRRSTDALPNGSNRNARPAKPTAIPTYAVAGRRRPKPIRSNSAIQIGIVPTSKAATPAGTVCCAQASAPWPVTKSSPPKMKPATICRRPIRSPLRSPRGSANTSSTVPAIRCRMDMARNGGRSRIAIARAMNVEPQTRYTVTRASQTRTPCLAAITRSCSRTSLRSSRVGRGTITPADRAAHVSASRDRVRAG